MPRGVYTRKGPRQSRKRKLNSVALSGATSKALKPKRQKFDAKELMDIVESTQSLPQTPLVEPKEKETDEFNIDDLLCTELSSSTPNQQQRTLCISYERKTSPMATAPNVAKANEVATAPMQQESVSIEEIFENVTLRAFQSIVGNQQQVRPTTVLEQWCIECKVPSYNNLPQPWFANIRFAFANNAYLVAAWCQTTRRCWCLDNQNCIYCVDLDELGQSKNCVVDKIFKPYTHRIRWMCESCSFGKLVFPFKLPVQSVASLLKVYKQ
jgi:hypothetical protein